MTSRLSPHTPPGMLSWGSTKQLDSSSTEIRASEAETPHSGPSAGTHSSAHDEGPPLTAPALPPECPQPPSIFSPPVHGARDQPHARPCTISATFYPRMNRDDVPADVILVSADDVLFYVHYGILRIVSKNSFCGLLPPFPPAMNPGPASQHSSPRVMLSEGGEVTEIMLYAIYALSFKFTSHSLATLVDACNGLRKYGVSAAHSLSSTSPLYSVILAFAPTQPMDVYALAAENDAFALARACSPHLISFDLVNLDEQLVRRLGPAYLFKLFQLHLKRLDALKELLRYIPRPHPQTSFCKNADQEKLETGWVFVAGDLIWEKRIDLTVDGLRARLEPLGEDLSCELCSEALLEATNDLVDGWSEVACAIW